MGMYIVEARCMVCEKVEYSDKPRADAQIDGIKTVYSICPDCKRAIMYARELLKEKERGAAE